MRTSTGIVRSIDCLGRFVIPKEMRRHLQINEGDLLEVAVEQDKIVIRKYDKACVLCSSTDNLSTFNEKQICRDCLNKIKAAF
ncbi:MAG: AbrB/MazE/SpoVT family DNA-binding domain-containing protein [Clostridia bacterium]|nr:AbrB/MazE/SpoVT family DNA-binding domain-containing protein [Clostridia bacterium]